MIQMDMSDDSYYPVYYVKPLDNGQTLCFVFDDDYCLRMVYIMPGHDLQNVADFEGLPIEELEQRGFMLV